MQTLEQRLRRLERRIGIDRQGRTVWVWAIPVVSGALIGVLFGVMPGFPVAADWGLRLAFGLFGLIATVAVSVICMMSFDNDRNQQADQNPER
jgi:hypothetical protein